MQTITVARASDIVRTFEAEWVAISLTHYRQMEKLFGPKVEAAGRKFHEAMFKKLAADTRLRGRPSTKSIGGSVRRRARWRCRASSVFRRDWHC